MAVVEKTWSITAQGKGNPDYTDEVARGKQIFGYPLEFGEQLLWITYICTEAPGPAVITRAPLTVAEGWVPVPNAATGLLVTPVLAGWDWVVKEFWMSWNQPVEFDIFQGGTYNDVSCRLECDSFFAAPINPFQQGWTRSLLEDINVASTVQVRIRNVGNADAVGKVWLLGMMKVGSYLWY